MPHLVHSAYNARQYSEMVCMLFVLLHSHVPCPCCTLVSTREPMLCLLSLCGLHTSDYYMSTFLVRYIWLQVHHMVAARYVPAGQEVLMLCLYSPAATVFKHCYSTMRAAAVFALCVFMLLKNHHVFETTSSTCVKHASCVSYVLSSSHTRSDWLAVMINQSLRQCL